MTEKQFEELISVLKEVKASLDALKAQPQYVLVSQPPQPEVPDTYYPIPFLGYWPTFTCGTNSVESKADGIQCFNKA